MTDHTPRRRARTRNVAEVGYSADPAEHRRQLESDLADLVRRGWAELVPGTKDEYRLTALGRASLPKGRR